MALPRWPPLKINRWDNGGQGSSPGIVGTSRSYVRIAFPLVGQERDPAVADHFDRGKHLIRCRPLLPDRDRTLLQRLNPLRCAHLLDLQSNLRELEAVLGLHFLDVCLHKLRRGPSESENEVGLHSLFDERLPRLINYVEPAQETFAFTCGDVERNLYLSQTHQRRLVVKGLSRDAWSRQKPE